MPERSLPPLGGVLALPDPRAARWQRALAALHLPEGALAMAGELARMAPGLDREARQDLTLLLLALLAEQGRGSTCLPLDDPALADRHLGLLEGRQAPPWERLKALLDRAETAPILGGPAASTPLVRVGERLFSRRYFRSETALAAAVRARMEAPGTSRPIEARLLQRPDLLSEEQARAVHLALERPLALVTGGPGTGKTAIVVAMLRAWLHGGLSADDLLLAAPTGKAAQRMGQSVRDTLLRLPEPDAQDRTLLTRAPEPRTLHRLLGWNPGQGSFRHHAGNPLAARAVIVDEASMIGQELMEALFRALAPGTALVLLGDPDQLPSVDAGQVFRDLVAALPGATQRLRHSYRMAGGGGHILQVAAAVNEGRVQDLWQGPQAIPQRERLADLRHQGVELLAPAAPVLKAFLDQWMEERVWTLEDGRSLDSLLFPPVKAPREGLPWAPEELLRVRLVLANYDRSRVLCPVNTGPALMEVDGLNEHFHRLALDRAREQLETTPGIIVGEPVMVLRNDYRRMLFNGDQGAVLMVRRDGTDRPEAFFPRGDGFVSFPLAAMRDALTLSYAMTVHKAQGSEFERVALVLPELEGDFVTRQILYTALTRARTAVTLLATPRAWEAGALRQEKRWSQLGERLAPPAIGETPWS
jgi:exodeoxyribonuclease V alpha subunit